MFAKLIIVKGKKKVITELVRKDMKEIEVVVPCPKCGYFMMDKVGEFIFCKTRGCKNRNIKYEYPKIKLKPYEQKGSV